MKAFFSILITLLSFCNIVSGQNIGIEWTKGVASYQISSKSICVDSQGNSYTTGNFDNNSTPVDFDPGPGQYMLSAYTDEIFILKLDADGNYIWAKKIGSSDSFDCGYSIALDPTGNVVISGIYYGTCDFDPGIGIYELTPTPGINASGETFVLKLDADGNFLWAKSFKSFINGWTYTFQPSLMVDNSGYIYFTGVVTGSGTVDIDPGPGTYYVSAPCYFIIKLDNQGTFLWARSFISSGISKVFPWVIANDGNLVSVGSFNGTVDFDPGPGVYELTSTTFMDIFILQLDNDGNFKWVKSIGNNDYSEFAGNVTVDPDGNICLTGVFGNPIDLDPGPNVHLVTSSTGPQAFILKLDSIGNYINSGVFSKCESASLGLKTLISDNNGNIYLNGYYKDSVDLDPGPGTYEVYSYYTRGFQLKLNDQFNVVWGFTPDANPLLNPYISSSSIDSLGNIYVTGNPGSETIIISKISQNYSSISDSYLSDFKIFPNPTDGIVNLSLPTKTFTKLSILNIMGQEVKAMDISSDQLEINLSSLSSGTYFILLQGNSHNSVKKLVKR